MSYAEAGDGPLPVLLVHGNFAGKSWWRELFEGPPPGSRLVAPDMPGFGSSAVRDGLRPSIPFYAARLSGFLDEVGLDRPLLVGHSFGGAVSTELALSEPGRFPAMFLLSSPHPPASTPPGTSTPSWRATATTAAASARPSATPSENTSPHTSTSSSPRGPADAPGGLLRQRPRLEPLERHRQAPLPHLP